MKISAFIYFLLHGQKEIKELKRKLNIISNNEIELSNRLNKIEEVRILSFYEFRNKLIMYEGIASLSIEIIRKYKKCDNHGHFLGYDKFHLCSDIPYASLSQSGFDYKAQTIQFMYKQYLDKVAYS